MIEDVKNINMKAVNYIVISAMTACTISGVPAVGTDTDIVGQLAFEQSIIRQDPMINVERYAGPISPNIVEPAIKPDIKIVRYAGPSMPDIVNSNIVRYAGPSMPDVVNPVPNILRYAGPMKPLPINPSSPDIVKPETMIVRYAGPQMPATDTNPTKGMNNVGNYNNFGAIELGTGHFIFK